MYGAGEPLSSLLFGSVYDLAQSTSLVTLGHDFEVDREDIGRLTGGTECLKTLDTDLFRFVHGSLQEFARIELVGVFFHGAAHGGGHGEANVGIDVYLAHAVADALAYFGDRDAIGLADLTAVTPDFLQQTLRHRG